MEDALKVIAATLTAVGAIGGFLYWHFSTLYKFKDKIHEIEKELLQLKSRDENQQEVIDILKGMLPELMEMAKKSIKK